MIGLSITVAWSRDEPHPQLAYELLDAFHQGEPVQVGTLAHPLSVVLYDHRMDFGNDPHSHTFTGRVTT